MLPIAVTLVISHAKVLVNGCVWILVQHNVLKHAIITAKELVTICVVIHVEVAVQLPVKIQIDNNKQIVWQRNL